MDQSRPTWSSANMSGRNRVHALLSAVIIAACLSVPFGAHAHPKGITLSSLHFSEEGIRIETILPDAFIEPIAKRSNQSPADVMATAYPLFSEAGPCLPVGRTQVWRLPDIQSTRYVVDYRCHERPRENLTVGYLWGGQADARGQIHENFMTIPWPRRSQTIVFSDPDKILNLNFSTFKAGPNSLFPQTLNETGIATPGAWDFVRIGAEHIVVGFDHIAFLLGLFLISLGWGAILAIVSAFTLGHSVTLSLASLGVYDPAPALVEIGIALSIVYVGAENLYTLLRPRPDAEPNERRRLTRRRWLLAGLFGLVHGFGFSGILRNTGLPESSQIRSLFGFNLGVEIGQLLILAALLPIITILWKKLSERSVSLVLSLAILMLGGWWLVERIQIMTG